MYTLQELWEIKKGPFTTKRGYYIIAIKEEPKKQYEEKKDVFGYIWSYNGKIHGRYTNIYNWDKKSFIKLKNKFL